MAKSRVDARTRHRPARPRRPRGVSGAHQRPSGCLHLVVVQLPGRRRLRQRLGRGRPRQRRPGRDQALVRNASRALHQGLPQVRGRPQAQAHRQDQAPGCARGPEAGRERAPRAGRHLWHGGPRPRHRRGRGVPRLAGGGGGQARAHHRPQQAPRARQDGSRRPRAASAGACCVNELVCVCV